MDQTQSISPRRRAVITVSAMAATLTVVLDATIANVAIPHMQAALGATSETVLWVLTSYIVGTAVAMPLTGWLADRIGKRELFAISVIGFTIASILCAVSGSLTAMVLSRLAQGVFGAFLVPLSQSTMYDINPPEKHAQAMTLWGTVVMIGPILGPVLGGYLTDSFDWRWVFLINVPIGLATLPALWLSMPSSLSQRRSFDFLGFFALAIALAAFQLVLDRGAHLDWFESIEIIAEAAIAIAALWVFAVHTISARAPLLPLGLFRDRNFIGATIFITLASGITIGGAALLAPMLQGLMGYPVLDTGLLIAPRGIGTMIGMLIAGPMSRHIDPRLIITAGMICAAWSLYIMTGFDLMMGKELIISSGFVQGLGVGLIFLPANLLAFATLDPKLRTDGASLYTMVRNIGSSIAIAALSSFLARNAQVSHADLGANIRATGGAADLGLTQQLGTRSQTVLAMMDAEINRQAVMIAYLNDFWLMMWAVVITAPLVLLMRSPQKRHEAVHVGE